MANEIGRRVALFRAEHNWSKADLARKADVSEAWLSRVESGVIAEPSGTMLGKIANALKVDVADILEGRPQPLSNDEQRLYDQIVRDPKMRMMFATVARMDDAGKRWVLKFVQDLQEHQSS